MSPDESSADRESVVPVVGIGASAGGIEPLKELLESLPSDPGYTLVVVQHKGADSDESLPELFSNYTSLPVSTIEDGTTLHNNHVYLNPGRSYVDLNNSLFQLTEWDTEKPLHNPIDHFFESLADNREHTSTGVILSGTGTDGSLGLKKIKYRGGITIVQDPETAQYPGMPENARETAEVDFVLKPGEITEKLAEIKEHPYVRGGESPEGKPQEDFSSEQVEEILGMVYDETGHDLRGYKHKPIRRRLSRQLAVHQIVSAEDYIRFLKENPERIRGLFRDLLIDYTRFFRDPESYEYLEREVLPSLLRGHPADQPLRIWVAGCATGPEVYSLVILLKELMERLDCHRKLKVFATDIKTEALDVAREGFYPEEIAASVPEDRLNKYFIPRENGFQVKSSLRECVIFAEHNLLQAPPYSNIDLISCRNLLIYLNEANQDRVLEILHYALNPEGVLFLGPTESIDGHKELFVPESNTHKIFRKQAHSEDLTHPVLNLTTNVSEDPNREFDPDPPSPQIVHQAEQRLIHRYGSPAVMIDESHSVLHFFGDTDSWLKHPTGEVSYNVVEMVEDSIKPELMNLLEQVGSENKMVSSQQTVKGGDVVLTVELTVELLQEGSLDREYYLVVFEDRSPSEKRTVAEAAEGYDRPDEDSTEDELREELESTKSYLHETIERLESKNKELRAKNRELQSLNEEYQSTNEELETAKEELQSTNEELMTVNQKLEEKVNRLDEVNNDMRNLLQATRIPVLFLDRELNIKRFTPAVTEVFNLIETDEGRPLDDITSGLENVDLTGAARDVLENLEIRKFEARTEDDRVYTIHVTPYRKEQDVVGGVVITLVEITEIRRAEQDARLLSEVLQNSNDAVIVVNREGIIEEWNRGAERLYGYTQDEACGMNLTEMLPENEEQLSADERLENLLESTEEKFFRTYRITKEGEKREVWVSSSTVWDESSEDYKIAFTDRDLNWLPGRQQGD